MGLPSEPGAVASTGRTDSADISLGRYFRRLLTGYTAGLAEETSMRLKLIPLFLLIGCGIAAGQTTRPTTQPSDAKDSLKGMSADQMLGQMLKPSTNMAKPLQPLSDKPVTDKTSGSGAVKPGAPGVNVLREGTFIVDRLCRLTHTDNGQAELTFESDGKALRDPPVLILPNLTLMRMEDGITASSTDLKFRVTGMVTEYRSRNYILLEKVEFLRPSQEQFDAK